MKEYLGKEKVIEILNSKESAEILNHSTFTVIKLISLVKNAPTADVVEVKHGKWLSKIFKVTGRKFITCSVCNSVIDSTYTHIHENEFDYCPYCGAKMDGTRKEENDNV